MATIKRRPNRGNRWEVRYRDDSGTQHAKLFDLKGDAETFMRGVMGDIVRGDYVDPNAGKQTFGTYAEQWRVIQAHRDTSAAQVESNLRNHVLPTFADRPIGAVRPSEIKAWIKGLDGVLKPSTIGVVYSYVASIFKAAVGDKVIKESPCVDIKLPEVPPKEIVPLPTENVEALIDVVPERYRALITVAAGTGMRQGEIFGLTLPRLDMLRRTIRVDQQLQLLPGAPPFLCPPKTKASYRTLPLPNVVLEALAAHLAAFPVTHEAGFVFTNTAGTPIRRTRFNASVWQPARSAAGLSVETHFHDLRHYYASLLIRHGESVKVVQARLGHASAKETLDTYSHLWPDSEDQTRAAVDGVLGVSGLTVAVAGG